MYQLFISLWNYTDGELKEVYEKLASFPTSSGYSMRRQNVSIGISHGGPKVDLQQVGPGPAVAGRQVYRVALGATRSDERVKALG